MFVSLTFDDGNEVQYTNFYPILEEYGLKATFYIITSQINIPGRLSEEQLKDLYRHGNEIGSHTHTHPLLTKLSDSKLEFELKRSKEILKPFRTEALAYPYGGYNERVIKYTSSYYTSARGYYNPKRTSSSFGLNMGLKHEKYCLKTVPFEHLTFMSVPILKLPLPKFKRYIKRIMENKSEKTWVIFTFHGPSRVTLGRILWLLKNKRVITLNMISALKDNHNMKVDFQTYLYKFKWLCEYVSTARFKVLPVSMVVNMLYK